MAVTTKELSAATDQTDQDALIAANASAIAAHITGQTTAPTVNTAPPPNAVIGSTAYLMTNGRVFLFRGGSVGAYDWMELVDKAEYNLLNASVLALSDANLGVFSTEAALTSAHPTANTGAFAIVDATNSFWRYDNDPAGWVNTGVSSGGTPLYANVDFTGETHVHGSITSNRVEFEFSFSGPTSSDPWIGFGVWADPTFTVNPNPIYSMYGLEGSNTGRKQQSQTDTFPPDHFEIGAMPGDVNKNVLISGLIIDAMDATKVTKIRDLQFSSSAAAAEALFYLDGAGKMQTAQVDDGIELTTQNQQLLAGNLKLWDRS